MAPLRKRSMSRASSTGGGGGDLGKRVSLADGVSTDGRGSLQHPAESRRRSSRFGNNPAEILANFDIIMGESDDIKDAETLEKERAVRAESKRKRLAKKGRRASMSNAGEMLAAKQRKEQKKDAKQIEREKQKREEKRKRAWSKAGVSQREVMEIIHSFQSLDEDLTGEIDPREFFSLPAFAGFADSGTMDTLFRAIDRDGSGTVTQEELLSVMFPLATKSDVAEMVKMAHRVRFGSKEKKEKKPSRLSDKQREDITTIFHMYDTDNSNSVSLVELLAAIGESLKGVLSTKEIADIFEKFDKDDNADLDLDEFVKLYEDYFLDPINEASGPPE